MNCINCKRAIQWDKDMQCEWANPDIKNCERFVDKNLNIKKMVEEMLE